MQRAAPRRASLRSSGSLSLMHAAWILVAVLGLAACAAGDPRFSSDTPAGFWMGLWHGVIAWVSLVLGVFDDSVRVYEVYNTGRWYDFGLLIGIACMWGGGARAYPRAFGVTTVRIETREAK
ncbi:hypothetical protein [Nannocystis pusilla]|uniref:hypothetical protein n=1 Tax=Nannocystis pusilla TaxID=889268 RepID=UPI003BF00F9C